jgi:hypothetical protein
MIENKPKDFIKFICMKCPNEIDDDPFPEGCTSYATRDCEPTLCPCRGIPDWRCGYIVWRDGERP